MNFHIPIYVAAEGAKLGTAYTARPLFFPTPAVRDDSLTRLQARLAEKLADALESLGKRPDHSELAEYSFSPSLTQHRLDVKVELRRRAARCRFLFVVFKHLGRRLAFTPAVPDAWFELARGEALGPRAAEVLSHHYRRLERDADDEADVRPEADSLAGTAWVATLELDVSPPGTITKQQVPRFLMLGGDGEKIDGGAELRRVGRCLDRLYPDDLDRAMLRDAEVAELTRLLDAPDRRPVLLLGPRQAGKTTVVHEFVYRRVAGRDAPHRNRERTWLIAPQRLISGMMYVGQWENRLLAILKEAGKHDHVLYFDDLVGLFRAGLTCNSTLSAAGVLKPHLERRGVRVLAESTPEAFRVLQERDRGFADLFHVVPVREPADADVLRILVGVQRQLENQHRCAFGLDVLPTVIDLQRRYERGSAFPGKAAGFLRQLAVKHRGSAEEVGQAQALAEYQTRTGIEMLFLDRQARLDRQEVLNRLGKQVVGQPAAIEAAADVISVAKARLNDPGRPLASFLFLGPTGVGKTECAKAIAAFLFGTAERLLRFDMNEFVSPGSAARLVGTFDQPEGLLTAAVRRQPFAVILLDEIEKADPEVFDLLLQVLGEGRLTDALGRTADFTNTIIVLTSNLGVREAEGRLGYAAGDKAAEAAFVRAAERFFRPEFFNRLDRVIPFGRLDRPHVRAIADRLVRDVFAREGFVQRKSVLRVGPRALERIVDAGFDPALGARALKRAVERKLAQPVAGRLAALPPDRFTIVQVYPGPDGGLAVHVQGLEQVGDGASRETTSPNGAGGDEEELRAVEAAVRRIEASVAHLRPEGAVTLGRVEPAHYRYFAVREQAGRIREACRQLAEQFEQRRLPHVTGPGSPVRQRSVKTLDHATWDGMAPGRLVRAMASALDLDEFLREAARAAPAPGRLEAAFADLRQQLALLAAMAGASGASDRALIIVRGLDQEAVARVLPSAEGLYDRAAFEPLGLEAEPVRGTSAVVVRGAHAAALLTGEAGTHLLVPRHANLALLQVDVLTPAPGTGDAAALAAHFDRQRQWQAEFERGLAKAEDDPFRYGPVVRVYHEGGSTFDLRGGRTTPTPPTPEALRGFLLAGLPAVELPAGPGDSSAGD